MPQATWLFLCCSGCFVLGMAGALRAQTTSEVNHHSGPDGASEAMTLTVELAVPDEAGFERAVQELYDPGSARYQQWMSDEELRRWAPPAGTVARVVAELAKHGLVIRQGEFNGFTLRVQGSAAAVRSAFSVPVTGSAASAAAATGVAMVGPKLGGGLDGLVVGVSGLVQQHALPATGPSRRFARARAKSSVHLSAQALTVPGILQTLFTDNCFTGPDQFEYVSVQEAFPKATYYGTVYGASEKGCGFSAKQLQDHYGLTAAYQKGYEGQGQTIVIVNPYESSEEPENDINIFSVLNGLPTLEAGQFQEVFPDGKLTTPGPGEAAGEAASVGTALEWTHAIAPKATIVLVSAKEDSDQYLQSALNYVIDHRLGNTVSNGWATLAQDEENPQTARVYNSILRRAAAKGIAMNFTSGELDLADNNPTRTGPVVPADSPYATAVGGTSILKYVNGTTLETGWGSYVSYLSQGGDPEIFFPPEEDLSLQGGSGGGESKVFAKPVWQGSLVGTNRQVPDVAVLADFYTPAISVQVSQGLTLLTSDGGINLSTAIFTAIWALADQAAGHALGQAAPRIARMTGNELKDVRPVSSPNNVGGVILTSHGPTFLQPFDLFSQHDYFPKEFISVLENFAPNSGEVISFGTDDALTVTDGWDNVTGWGVPNGLAFIEGAAAK